MGNVFKLHRFGRLRSTSDQARVMLERGALIPPAIVMTGRQTAGRGRGANSWWSGEGCLTATFVLPAGDEPAAPHVPLFAGVAVRQGLAILSGSDEIRLKWPNDLLVGDRKLAGILCERVGSADLIGVGVNVAPKRVPRKLAETIASLAEVSEREIEIDEALIALTGAIGAVLLSEMRPSFPTILQAYDQYHALLGREVTVWPMGDEPAIAGRCEGLDRQGRLVVRAGAGANAKRHHVVAGTVRLAQ